MATSAAMKTRLPIRGDSGFIPCLRLWGGWLGRVAGAGGWGGWLAACFDDVIFA